MPALSSSRRPIAPALATLLLLPAGFAAAQQSETGGGPVTPPSPAAPAPQQAAAGQPQGPRRAVYIEDHEALPSATAVRTNQAIEVDGVLDEAIWMTAEPETEFWQYDPDEGLLYPERTEVRFLYDDEALYIGAWIYDSNITTRLARKDGFANDTDIMAF
jgi:hypothetical protein